MDGGAVPQCSPLKTCLNAGGLGMEMVMGRDRTRGRCSYTRSEGHEGHEGHDEHEGQLAARSGCYLGEGDVIFYLSRRQKFASWACPVVHQGRQNRRRIGALGRSVGRWPGWPIVLRNMVRTELFDPSRPSLFFQRPDGTEGDHLRSLHCAESPSCCSQAACAAAMLH